MSAPALARCSAAEPARGKAFTVYCAGLKEYLPLVVTGSDRNHSQYTAGGASLGTDVRTSLRSP